MPEAITRVVPSTGLRVARDEILAKLKSIKDLNKNPLFESVGMGLYWPGADKIPKDFVPACRLWYGPGEHEINNVQFSAGRRRITIGLYIYEYSFLKDAQGNIVDLQDHVDGMTMYVLNNLRKPDGSGIGFEIVNKAVWYFEPKQTVVTDSGNVLKQFNQNFVLPPNWFMSKILFDINVHNIGL